MARKSEASKQHSREYNRQYYADNREEEKKRIRKWRESHPEHVRQMRRNAWRRRYESHAREEIERINDWKRRNKSAVALNSSINVIAEKLAFIEAYGGACECCKEDRFEFLTADHVKGNGKKLRKAGEKFGFDLYRKLRLAGYPKGDYRLLCISCNFAYGSYGYCPHQFEANREYGITACG